jgi:hypothetical protein
MTILRQLGGTLIVAIFAPAFAWGQVGTTTNPPSPPPAIRDAVTVTNAPAATPLTVPQPAERQITVPRPVPVEIPLATAPSPVSTVPALRPRSAPLTPPTAQELVSKSIGSAPGGSQNKLNAIAAPPLALSPTNAGTATPNASSSSSTNSPVGQPNIWQQNSPLLNGVNYHW